MAHKLHRQNNHTNFHIRFHTVDAEAYYPPLCNHQKYFNMGIPITISIIGYKRFRTAENECNAVNRSSRNSCRHR